MHRTQTYRGRFHFDPDDPIYKDHFPGQPVVPGSLIVQAFMVVAEQLPGMDKVSGVSNFRFMRFVRPGSYAYRLELSETDQDGPSLFCTLHDGNRILAGGILR